MLACPLHHSGIASLTMRLKSSLSWAVHPTSLDFLCSQSLKSSIHPLACLPFLLLAPSFAFIMCQCYHISLPKKTDKKTLSGNAASWSSRRHLALGSGPGFESGKPGQCWFLGNASLHAFLTPFMCKTRTWLKAVC